MQRAFLTTDDFWENTKEGNFSCRILLSPDNKRITICNFNISGPCGVQSMMRALTAKALKHGLDKIWLKTPASWVQDFEQAGLQEEAAIPGFYQGTETAYLLSMFLTASRKTPAANTGFNWTSSKLPAGKKTPPPKPDQISLAWGRQEDCSSLARLYSKIFSTYPFPISNPDYVKYTMKTNVRYITAWHDKELIAAAAAEMDHGNKNAELTDFATRPAYRAQGLAQLLLEKLEQHLQKKKFRCLYTIARSNSTGMNKTFYNCGYHFRGVLTNNCHIAGDFENMNVWSKII